MGLHIIRRGAVYRWRRRVPKALVGLLGQDHMSASLRTTDRPTAQRLALRLSVATDEMFERIRTMPRQAKIEEASKDEVRRMDAMIRDLLRTPGAAARILDPRSRPTTSKAPQEADGTTGSPDPLPDSVHVGAVDRDDPADEGGGLAKAVVSGVARRVAYAGPSSWPPIEGGPGDDGADLPRRVRLRDFEAEPPSALGTWVRDQAFLRTLTGLETIASFRPDHVGPDERGLMTHIRSLEKKALKAGIAADDAALAESVLSDILDDAGFVVEPTTRLWAYLGQQAMRGRLHAMRYREDPFEIQRPAPPPVVPEKAATRDLVIVDRAEPADEMALPSIDDPVSLAVRRYLNLSDVSIRERKTRDDVRLAARLFCALVGDVPLSIITKAQAKTFREKLSRLPANHRDPPYKGLAPSVAIKRREAIAAALRDGRRDARELAGLADADHARITDVLSLGTISKHVRSLGKMFRVIAETEDHDERLNPFRNLGYKKSDIKDNAKVSRTVWSHDDYRTLFSSEWWQGWRGNEGMPRGDWRRDMRTWVPLIGALSFMRLEEIVALRPSEVEQIDGTWCFRLRGTGPRRLKTTSSARIVVIHPLLVDLGLVSLAHDRRRHGEEFLFSDVPKQPIRGRYSHKFTMEFTALRRTLGVYQKGMDFHAMRTTGASELAEQGASLTLRSQMLGHSHNGTVTDEAYLRSNLIGAQKRQLSRFSHARVIKDVIMGATQTDFEALLSDPDLRQRVKSLRRQSKSLAGGTTAVVSVSDTCPTTPKFAS